MMARRLRFASALALVVAGCADHPTDSNGSGGPPPNATINAPSTPVPLSSTEIDRYRNELGKLMPEKRVIRPGGGPAPAGFDVATIEGFDHVMISRRTADGRTQQACVDTVQGGLQFLSGPGRGGETE
jgi:hypothetical protein